MVIYSKWKHQENHEIKPSLIPPPSPKSRKYLYANGVYSNLQQILPNLEIVKANT